MQTTLNIRVIPNEVFFLSWKKKLKSYVHKCCSCCHNISTFAFYLKIMFSFFRSTRELVKSCVYCFLNPTIIGGGFFEQIMGFIEVSTQNTKDANKFSFGGKKN